MMERKFWGLIKIHFLKEIDPEACGLWPTSLIGRVLLAFNL